mmetsp:Transcript_18630/g.60214  ORF Transcript_18630/g.60214 Transcript_18630/m.60214 type:complete len:199 (-) Transcript_18630:669-1265(-)
MTWARDDDLETFLILVFALTLSNFTLYCLRAPRLFARGGFPQPELRRSPGSMGQVLQRLVDIMYAKKLEVVLVGLENSGKTTLLNVLAAGRPVETCPTIGLNVKLVRKGGVQMKCWDIGGQAQYRSEWGRYTRGCDVIIYVVDAHAYDMLPLARKELHRLLEGTFSAILLTRALDRELVSTPMLVSERLADCTTIACF